MSETNNTDQTCPGFFKRPRIGDRIRAAWLVWNMTRMANVLELMTGTGGIVIRKPRHGDGAGWTVDGSGITASGGIPAGYEEETVNLVTDAGIVTRKILVETASKADVRVFDAGDAQLLLQVDDEGKLTLDKGYLVE